MEDRFGSTRVWLEFPSAREYPTFSEQVLVKTQTGVEARARMVTLPELPGVASFFVDG